MKIPYVIATILSLSGCGNKSSGREDCVAAGGQCLVGGPLSCSTKRIGPQDCNPDLNPGGAVCCLPAVPAAVDAGTD
jgi:hypothetical protein